VLEEAEEITVRRRREVDRERRRLQRRREDLDKRLERVEQRDQNLNKRQSRMDKQQQDLQKLGRRTRRRASADRAVDDRRSQAGIDGAGGNRRRATIWHASSVRLRRKRTKKLKPAPAIVISIAVQRLASEHVSEIAVSVVSLPSDEMKGRIIGRNGRNIRSFELATGVDVVVDDTPEAVTISSFDPVRREVAKRAMAKLVIDGRIHPARIEKLVEDANAEVEVVIRQVRRARGLRNGDSRPASRNSQAAGTAQVRTSYGQNQHSHSIETSHIAGMIAAELGADVMIAKTGGLLHDLGKAIDHEVEGTHALIGAGICQALWRRAAHHPTRLPAITTKLSREYVESYIVEAADAIFRRAPRRSA